MKSLRTVNIVLGLVLIPLLVVIFWPKKSAQPPSVSELEQAPVAPQVVKPEIRYPLPEVQPPAERGATPLPALSESNSFTNDLLGQLFGEPARNQLLVPQQFIRRLVLIIDALPRQDLPRQHLPLRGPSGSFQTAGKDGAEIIATANFRRYAPYVKLAEAVPPRQLADSYLRIYPLLEQAYRELGHPRGYFHDRMIEVLDHLLATPQLKGPIALEEHIGRYRYADPALESRSAGQKILLRMGPDNAHRVKNVLRQLRELLVVRQAESLEQTDTAYDSAAGPGSGDQEAPGQGI